jgi:hypothetical protein
MRSSGFSFVWGRFRRRWVAVAVSGVIMALLTVAVPAAQAGQKLPTVSAGQKLPT